MMTHPPFLTHPLLEADGIHHGFFTRHGGVSRGLYASLNGGFGSADDPDSIRRNRAAAATALGGAGGEICGLYQIHSNIVHDAAPQGAYQKGDGLVTDRGGLTLTILTADCAPVLFLDRKTRMMAACHAGWRGAVGGIVEATISHMEGRGAGRPSLVAVIGPAIGQESYQVRDDVRDAVLIASPWAEGCFMAENIPDNSPDNGPRHFRFDLAGYILGRLHHQGVEAAALAVDTYGDERFFSHRRTTHQGLGDCGRMLSMIRRSP